MADWRQYLPFLPIFIGLVFGPILREFVFTHPAIAPFAGYICTILFAVVFYFLIAGFIYHTVGGGRTD
jgi:hypothetical protein